MSGQRLGLQSLRNICQQYAHTWKMKFNPTKTNIDCIGKQPHTTPPVWTLGDSTIHLSKDTNILGVSFNSQLCNTVGDKDGLVDTL